MNGRFVANSSAESPAASARAVHDRERRFPSSNRRSLTLLLLISATLLAGGCVRRTIMIRSTPPGALVWVNDREIGRTPVDFDFLHYGTYDVRLELAGYEPLSTSGQADPPWWDVVGPDLVSELLPMDLRSEILWEYDLQPAAESRPGLLERAHEMRESMQPASDLPSYGH